MKHDCHVVFVIGRIESRDVDGALTKAISIIGSVEGGLPVVSYSHAFAANCCRYVFNLMGDGETAKEKKR